MKARMLEEENSCVAATVAPEDLRRGDFVAVLSQIVELPTFLWDDILPNSRDELVRIRYLPTDDRVPLKVKAMAAHVERRASIRGNCACIVRESSLRKI